MQDGLFQVWPTHRGHHKDFLGGCPLASHQLVSPCDRGGHPQLQFRTAATHPADHGRGDRLDLRLVGQGLQPWDQAVHIGAVGDDDPAQS